MAAHDRTDRAPGPAGRAAPDHASAAPGGGRRRRARGPEHVAVRDPLVVAERPGANQREIATYLQYSPNRIVADLHDLETRGWLTRRPGPDRRANLLAPTEAGEAVRPAHPGRDPPGGGRAPRRPDDRQRASFADAARELARLVRGGTARPGLGGRPARDHAAAGPAHPPPPTRPRPGRSPAPPRRPPTPPRRAPARTAPARPPRPQRREARRRPARPRRPRGRNFAEISVRISSPVGERRPPGPSAAHRRPPAPRRAQPHLDPLRARRPSSATCSNASASKSAPSSRLSTRSTLRLNSAVTPAASS